MSLTVELNEEGQHRVERLMRDCGFVTAEEAVMHSLKAVQEAGDVFSPEELAAIREGLADIDAGRVVTGKDVLAELQARYATP